MFVDISIDWVPSDGSAKSKYMCIFYFTRGCQIVLQTYGASLFSSQPVTKYLLPQSPTSSWYHQNFSFYQFKGWKMQSHFHLCEGSSLYSSLFHFFQLAGTLMKITYNNFSDLIKYVGIPWIGETWASPQNDQSTHFGKMFSLWELD